MAHVTKMHLKHEIKYALYILKFPEKSSSSPLLFNKMPQIKSTQSCLVIQCILGTFVKMLICI